MGSQRVGYDLMTQQQQQRPITKSLKSGLHAYFIHMGLKKLSNQGKIGIHRIGFWENKISTYSPISWFSKMTKKFKKLIKFLIPATLKLKFLLPILYLFQWCFKAFTTNVCRVQAQYSVFFFSHFNNLFRKKIFFKHAVYGRKYNIEMKVRKISHVFP